jgi:hypothetical protein
MARAAVRSTRRGAKKAPRCFKTPCRSVELKPTGVEGFKVCPRCGLSYKKIGNEYKPEIQYQARRTR